MTEAFDKSCDSLHDSGKVNGLLQAQCIALQAAIDAPDDGARSIAQEIAAAIGDAASFLAKERSE